MEKFLNELTENDELRALFLQQETIEQAYAVAKPYLEDDMTLEEFSEEMQNLARNIIESGSLTDEMLEQVSGGKTSEEVWSCQLVAIAMGFK